MSKWECSICLESNFPMLGSCGHCVCEMCVEKTTDCPKCRKKNSFSKPVPNWELAGLVGIERKQIDEVPDDLFCLKKTDLITPVTRLKKMIEYFDTLPDKLTHEETSSVILALDCTKSFEEIYSNIVIPRLTGHHKVHRKPIYKNDKLSPYMTRIPIRKSPYTASFFARKLRKHRRFKGTTFGRNNTLIIKEREFDAHGKLLNS